MVSIGFYQPFSTQAEKIWAQILVHPGKRPRPKRPYHPPDRRPSRNQPVQAGLRYPSPLPGCRIRPPTSWLPPDLFPGEERLPIRSARAAWLPRLARVPSSPRVTARRACPDGAHVGRSRRRGAAVRVRPPEGAARGPGARQDPLLPPRRLPHPSPALRHWPLRGDRYLHKVAVCCRSSYVSYFATNLKLCTSYSPFIISNSLNCSVWCFCRPCSSSKQLSLGVKSALYFAE
jgi:hypothetical protein